VDSSAVSVNENLFKFNRACAGPLLALLDHPLRKFIPLKRHGLLVDPRLNRLIAACALA
jgi:hypothetical protein